MTPAARDDVLAAWTESDQSAAISLDDRRVIQNTTSVRALIVELALRDPVSDDLFDACASLGRLIAQQHGSPSLVSATMAHAREALGGGGGTWLAGARAALYEGFSASLVDMARAEAMMAWEFPRCAVKVADRTIAIAAGHPADEADVLEAWAGRAARAAALMGIRCAIVDGQAGPRAAMITALNVVGIEVKRSC